MEPDNDNAVEGRIGLGGPHRGSGGAGWSCRRDAGIGVTPHSAAKAASEWSRSGLLPAVTSKAAAVSDPIPKMLTRAGDALWGAVMLA